jgi:hypothetical protein
MNTFHSLHQWLAFDLYARIKAEQCDAHEAADRAVCQWRASLRRLGDRRRYRSQIMLMARGFSMLMACGLSMLMGRRLQCSCRAIEMLTVRDAETRPCNVSAERAMPMHMARVAHAHGA